MVVSKDVEMQTTTMRFISNVKFRALIYYHLKLCIGSRVLVTIYETHSELQIRVVFS